MFPFKQTYPSHPHQSGLAGMGSANNHSQWVSPLPPPLAHIFTVTMETSSWPRFSLAAFPNISKSHKMLWAKSSAPLPELQIVCFSTEIFFFVGTGWETEGYPGRFEIKMKSCHFKMIIKERNTAPIVFICILL